MKLKKELMGLTIAGALVMAPAWAYDNNQDRAEDDQWGQQDEAFAPWNDEAEERRAEAENDVAVENDNDIAMEDENDVAAAEDGWQVQVDDEMAEVEPPVSDDLIRQLQQALSDEGHEIAVDGIWGPETQDALSQYQQDEGLDSTGQLDTQTLAQLELHEREDVAMAEEDEQEEEEDLFDFDDDDSA